MKRQPDTDRKDGPDARAMIVAEAATGCPAPEADPKTLPLADLQTAPDVFQMRHALISLTRQPETVAALWQLIRQGVTLDPMTVWWSGARWIVLDGHHRLAAYQEDAADKGTPAATYCVPVAAFTGTLSEAILEAGRENAKVRNPTSGPERQEWAWKLMLSDSALSGRAIAKVTGVSAMQTTRMRKVKADLTAKGVTLAEMLDRGWHRCRADEGKRMMDPDDVEAFAAKRDETAKRFLKALEKEFGGTWHRQADAFAYALATYAPKSAKMLVDSDHLWQMVQEVQRVERDAEAEEAAELADRARRNHAATVDDPTLPF